MSIGDTMKKFIKTILITVLAVCCVFSAFACNSNGGSKKDPGLYYKVKSGEEFYTVNGYVKEDGVSVLDLGTYNKDGVVIGRIASGAFSGNDSIKELIIPETVTEIAQGAFKNMKKLEKITVPFIGKNAKSDAFFKETESGHDKSVDVERTFAYFFGTEAYDGGAKMVSDFGDGSSTTYYVSPYLKEVTITCADQDREAYSIPMYAFKDVTVIDTVNLVGNIKAIGSNAFNGCHALSKINLPKSVENIYSYAFAKTVNLDQGISIENGSALKKIDKNAFEGSKLSSLVLPSSVTEIGAMAFKDSNITEITLSEDLTLIGAYAFYNCQNLSVVNESSVSGIVKLMNNAFEACKNLDADTLTKIDTTGSSNVFYGTK